MEPKKEIWALVEMSGEVELMEVPLGSDDAQVLKWALATAKEVRSARLLGELKASYEDPS